MTLNEVPIVDTTHCHYNRASRQLVMSSDIVGMPRHIRIRSVHTGRVEMFVPIGPDHPQFCQDGWDGELRIYEPVNTLDRVKTLVISNFL